MAKNIVLLVRQDGLGSLRTPEAEFGRTMFERFLHSLESRTVKPTTICFYTDGVRLACRGSAVIFALRLLEGMGVRLVLCSSCLERFGLKDQVEVGEIGGMNEIVQILMDADSVITI